MRKRGAALVVVLLLVMVIGGIATLMFSRTVNEIKNSASNASIVQTLMLARGGAAAGGSMLTGPVSQDLNQILQAQYSRTDRWAFGGNALGSSPSAQQVATDLRNKIAQNLQSQVDTRICNMNLPSVSGASTSLRMYFTNSSTVCGTTKTLPSAIKLSTGRFVSGSPRTGNGDQQMQTYALPFVMISEGNLGPYHRNIVLQGEYRFDLGVKNFARFALFTNHHTTESGTEVWFYDQTSFSGPVHTNQNFRFRGQPTFGGKVTSAGCIDPGLTSCNNNGYNQGAIFYGVNNDQVISTSNLSPNATAPSYTNGSGTHQPNLSGGVAWNENFIPLPTTADDQKTAAQTGGGLYINGAVNSIKLTAGTATLRELSPNGSGGWTPAATYQYIQVCPSSGSCTDYRYGADNVLQVSNSGSWVKVKDNFNGMVFADGAIGNLYGPARSNSADPNTAPPAIASFAKLTVANAGSNNNIQIKSDLKYETVPCPESLNGGTDPCTNLDADNVLGVYSQNGKILLGDGTNNSLADLTIHATLMSSQGSVAVQNADSIQPRGRVHLLGGLISNYYGIFGYFDASTGTLNQGYGRDFVYDQRMSLGAAPPYFPGSGFDVGGTPVVVTFGQREQVY